MKHRKELQILRGSMLLQMPEDVNIIDKVKEWNIEYLNPKQ